MIDQGNLSLTTDTLIVNNLYDTDTAKSEGFSVDVSINVGGTPSNDGQMTLPKNGQTTTGGHYNGYEKEQTTYAAMGNGRIQIGGEEQTGIEGLNRDITNVQEITKDIEIGGLDASVTVDHRLFSEEGREGIVNDFDKTGELAQDAGNGLADITQIQEDDNYLYMALNFITTNTGGLLAEVPVLIGQGDIKNQQIQVVTDGSKYMKGREDDFQPIKESEYYKSLPKKKQEILDGKNLFVTKKDVYITMDTATYQNSTNGMLNDEGLAIINAMQQTSKTDKENKVVGDVAFTLNYNPTHGILSDALESGLDTSGFWTTGIAKQTGGFLRDVTTARGTDGSNFNNHSQGNILNRAGLNYINSKGSYEEGGFKSREYFVDESKGTKGQQDAGIPTWAGFGSPVNTVDMKKTVFKENGFNFQGMFTHEGDYVGEGIGGNKLDNEQVKAPIFEKANLVNAFKLFGEKSPHSTYGCSENGNAKCGEI